MYFLGIVALLLVSIAYGGSKVLDDARRHRWWWVALGTVCTLGVPAIYVWWFWITLLHSGV